MMPDDVWRRLHDEAARSGPGYIGYKGAINRFLRFFPNGFDSAGFDEQERQLKVAARNRLNSSAPLESALTGSGFGEAVLAVYRATPLLYPVEKTRLQSLLRGSDADRFVRAAAEFAVHETPEALREMAALLKPHENAKWTVVTYLPFLWRPERHMFLKPEVTKAFAERVGHLFADQYQPQIGAAVYEDLLDLAGRTRDELASLRPRDNIDLQGFIWTVGDYQEGRESVYP